MALPKGVLEQLRHFQDLRYFRAGAGDWTFSGNLTVTGNLTLSSMAEGSVLFAGPSGLVSQDNSNLFWDDATDRLGVGTNGPAVTLDVRHATDDLIASFASADNLGSISIADDDTATFINAEASAMSLGFTNALNLDNLNVFATGNVSLGTVSDTARKLAIYDDSGMTAQLLLQQLDDGNSAMQFNRNGGESYMAGLDYSDAERFRICSGAGSFTQNGIVVDDDNKVGVGVPFGTALSTEFEVHIGTATTVPQVKITNTDNGDAAIRFSRPASTDYCVGLDYSNKGTGNYPKFVICNGTALGANDHLSLDSAGVFHIGQLTPSRILGLNAGNDVVVVTMAGYITGTANQITVTDDGDGSVTLSTPQDLDTAADFQVGTFGVGMVATGTIQSGTSNAANTTHLDTYDDGATYTALNLRKSDSDTVGTIAQTDDTDVLGSIGFWGVNNTGPAFVRGAWIDAVQDGVAIGLVPTNLIFQTTSAVATNTSQFVLHNDGASGFGTVTPSTNVHVYENAASTVPQLLIEQDDASGDVGLSWLFSGGSQFSAGIDVTDGFWKLNNGATVGASDHACMSTTGRMALNTTPTTTDRLRVRMLNTAGAATYTGIYVDADATNRRGYGFYVDYLHTATVTGNKLAYGFYLNMHTAVTAGQTMQGNFFGGFQSVLHDSAGNADYVVGNNVQYGNGGGAGTTAEAVGYSVRPYYSSGTVTLSKAFEVQGPAIGGTVTAGWVFYSNWAKPSRFIDDIRIEADGIAATSGRLTLGASDDAEVYYNGTQLYLDSAGDIKIESASAHILFEAVSTNIYMEESYFTLANTAADGPLQTAMVNMNQDNNELGKAVLSMIQEDESEALWDGDTNNLTTGDVTFSSTWSLGTTVGYLKIRLKNAAGAMTDYRLLVLDSSNPD